MAGHSQFKNIMHRKGAQDAKRAKAFTRIARELHIAVSAGGDDPQANPRLRLALQNARAVNMPKDNIERAIKKALGGEQENLESVRYEGYAPGGIAIIVEATTNNRNRTASHVRAIFTKHGGSLAEANAVAFGFLHQGLIIYPDSVGEFETVWEIAIEAGAADCEKSDEGFYGIYTAFDDFFEVIKQLEDKLGSAQETKILWRSQHPVVVTDEAVAVQICKLVRALDDDEDVDQVYDSSQIAPEILDKISD